MIPAGGSGCDEIRQALGVYVVGAIDPAERSMVDRHLATCSACRDELAGLAGLPALLGRVTLEEAERGPGGAAQLQAPPQLLGSMLTEQARWRGAKRRRNILVAVAASVAMIAGAGAAAAALVSGTARPPAAAAHEVRWTTVSAHNAATNISASVRYRPRSWGTEMNVWVSGVPVGTKCQLWVTDSSGRRMVAGGWDVPTAEEAAWYPGSAPAPADAITSFQITAHGKTLITLTS
jgi:anti-sigma factor RsiW